MTIITINGKSLKEATTLANDFLATVDETKIAGQEFTHSGNLYAYIFFIMN